MLLGVAVFLLCATALSIVYLVREHNQVRELTAKRDEMSVTLAQVRAQLDEMSGKSAAVSSAPPAAVAVVGPAAAPAAGSTRNERPRPTAHRAARRRPAPEPQWKRMQEQLSEQQKQLASTREDLDKTREDLQNKLSSTRDELSGSIARNHDELVALAKRGERNYYEFQLTKSKQFQRVGPVSLSLRKANVKHKSYDLALVVDDNPLNKKNINLYEPVWISLSDRPEPLQLVVNQVSQNQVRGYLSEPKYKKPELASASADAQPERPQLQQH
jgi:hypothetical protein